VLAAREGLVARLRTDRSLLRGKLRHVQIAFPDQSALAIAVGDKATYADLVTAVVSARADDQGVPLFPAQALLPFPPKTTGSIEARIERRAKMVVQGVMETKGTTGLPGLALNQQVRRCYLEAADRKGTTLGLLDFQIGPRGVIAVKKAGAKGCRARDAKLEGCVRERLEQARPRLKGVALGDGSLVHVEPQYVGCRGFGK
jgi:hypothetical protein